MSGVSLLGDMNNFPTEPRAAAEIMMARGIKVIPFKIKAGPKGEVKIPLLKRWVPYDYSWQMIGPQITNSFGIVVPKGIIVIDLDTDKNGAYAGLDALADLALDCGITDFSFLNETMCVDTASGGQHLYFRVPPNVRVRNSASSIGKNIDIRVAGKGLVIVPPSLNSVGDPYIFSGSSEIQKLPIWLLKKINEVEIEKAEVGAAIRKIDMDLLVNDKSVAKYLERRTSHITATAPGQRNNTLNAVAYSIYRRVTAGLIDQYAADIAIENAALMCGLDETEIHKTMASALRAAEDAPIEISPAKK